MRTIICLTVCLALTATTVAEHGPEGITLNPPDKLEWKDGPPSLPKGAKIAVLEGDPGKDGPFVFRVKVPDGYRIPPHTHPKMERVTVISGQFNIGMGEKLTRMNLCRCRREPTDSGNRTWLTSSRSKAKPSFSFTGRGRGRSSTSTRTTIREHSYHAC
jgi:hypothetical protein